MLVGYLKEVLAQHGVTSLLKNAYLGGGVGELPPTECWPELWVGEADYVRAHQLLQELLSGAPAASWRCPDCGEQVEGQFGVCWRCGHAAP